MNPKAEKLLGIVAAIIVVVTAVLLFIVGPERFSDPETTEYILKLLLYPFALILLRAIWKTLLDNKIRSRAERQADLDQAEEDAKAKE